MSREVFIVEQRKDRSGWLILLAVVVAIAYWKWVIVGAICYGISKIILHFVREAQARNDRRISKEAAMALRADHENQLAMAGDPLGVYGEYTPPTMPITSVGLQAAHMTPMPQYNLDNHNDGFKDW